MEPVSIVVLVVFAVFTLGVFRDLMHKDFVEETTTNTQTTVETQTVPSVAIMKGERIVRQHTWV